MPGQADAAGESSVYRWLAAVVLACGLLFAAWRAGPRLVRRRREAAEQAYAVTFTTAGRAVSAAGMLVETVLQLLVNTVSFVRVGAFALAHGGLSMAFNIMADATGNLFASLLLLALGNLVVMALEGLVVTIQTTRLILFEFFIRFLQGSGRAFRPLTAPATEAGIRRMT